MENYVRLTANAGVLLCVNGKKILIDALHNDPVVGYSVVPQETIKEVISGSGDFDGIDYFIITHDHPDHVTASLVQSFINCHPETIVFAPVSFHNCEHMEYLMLPAEDFVFGEDSFHFRKTVHEGVEYKDVTNYAGIIDIAGTRISFLGDSALNKNIASGIFTEGVDIGLFNFPFITLNRGRSIIESFDPEICIVCHLPFLKDDVNGYTDVTLRVYEKRADQLMKTVLLCNENQKEYI